MQPGVTKTNNDNDDDYNDDDNKRRSISAKFYKYVQNVQLQ